MAAQNRSGREEHKNPWLRGDVLALIGILVTVFIGLLGIATGAIVQIEPARVGCLVHLTACQGRSPALPGLPVLVDASPDPNLPFAVERPAPHSTGNAYPTLALSLPAIVNRGKGVAEALSGFGFYANSSVEIQWFQPDGSTYTAGGAQTDNRGLFTEELIWRPLQFLGTSGNNGAWKMSVKDRTSGVTIFTQVNVSSDKQTPPPSSWDTSNNGGLKSSSHPGVIVGTSGHLCVGEGVRAELSASGFTPGAGLDIDILRPDGERQVGVGETADALGGVHELELYWKTNNCNSAMTFIYDVLVTELDNGWQAKAKMSLSTL